MSDLMLFVLFGAVVGLASAWLCRHRQAVWSVAAAGAAALLAAFAVYQAAAWNSGAAAAGEYRAWMPLFVLPAALAGLLSGGLYRLLRRMGGGFR
ncbi:MAG: hypothetical protein Q4A62_10545 [Eikenella sp.]|nr:hypothetical protein [Eikenella sp.]